MRRNPRLPKELLDLCARVKAKRAKTVIDHILKYGSITTEELEVQYGYSHGPRAARDVREQGIPLKTDFVSGSHQRRKIASYSFDVEATLTPLKIGGRIAFTKEFKKELIARYGNKCTLTGAPFPERYLQIDHRVPYEIAGNAVDKNDKSQFMLLDASSQRAKSWSCEHCKNFQPTERNPDTCKSCYWASPEQYTHIATEDYRMLTLTWRQEDTNVYTQLKELASEEGIDIVSLAKQLIAKGVLQH